jgi:hypothetical protein
MCAMSMCALQLLTEHERLSMCAMPMCAPQHRACNVFESERVALHEESVLCVS